MSLETRTNSALFKRAEQLKRWEESDTNREPVSPKHISRKVKFSSGCVFLAACAAGDKEEVLNLLESGADINTANVDGLTALHQACIDDNLDMVEFLVDQGADVNRGDNEGWTPLHATASCGFMYIAKYLIEKGANVAAVNNDSELAIDIAECQKMEDLLRDEIRKRGIDCDAARNDEEIAMLKDAKEWLATKSSLVNESHSKTGATPLHVAAAKGYIDVIKILLQCGADIDAQDVDGWSPIHAAAHWGQKEACRLLVENLVDMDAKNYAGQTAFDLADNDMLGLLEDLKKKQNKEEVNKRKAKKRVETQDRTIEPDSQTQVKKVKVEITGGPEENTKNNDIEMEVSDESQSETETETSESESEEASSEEDEKKNRVNSQTINDKVTIKEPEITKPPLPVKTIENSEEKMPWRQQITKPKSEMNSPEKSSVGFKDYKNISSNLNNDNEITLRRTKSFQNDESFYTKYKALHARIQAYNDTTTNNAVISPYNTPSARPKSDIILTNSTESHYRSNKDDKSNEVSTSTANSTSVTSSPTKTTSPATSPQPQNNQSAYRSGLRLALNQSTPASANGSTTPTKVVTPTTTTPPTSTVIAPTTPGGTRFQIFKNFFKSFVPPVRDEESETQRKAHAKRVRETRRSTQGVTLEEIKSAEQLVKLKNQPNNNNNDTQGGGDSATNPAVSVSVTISTGTPTVITRSDTVAPSSGSGGVSSESSSTNGSSVDSNASITAPAESHERRPSWRLKVDGGSKFKLEDATKPETRETPTTPSFVRRLNPTTNAARPSSAPIDTAETTVTIPLRRPKSVEEKEQDKENDARNAQATLATQAAIQRRRRPKRRSTGVVNFDNVEDMDQEKDPAAGGDNLEATKLAQECDKMSTSSYHTSRSKQPIPPVRHRSSSAARSGTNSYNSRPRSVGYYGSNSSSPYGSNSSNPYGSSTSAYSSPYNSSLSSYGGYNSSYGSSYQSPYFPNGYRGATGSSGYASLTIPSKALTNVNVLTPNYSKSYDNNRDYIKNDAARRSRRELARGNSYRDRSVSRSRNSLPGSGMGSRSISLTSLNSEGYISGSERSSRSRISSTVDIRNENGEIDYKKLYEEQLVENDRLKDKLRKSDEELRETKQTLERINLVTSKNSLSELEKRERRAMERKLSEMEEELKNLENLKTENQRLKDENGALIRVISKLSK